MNYVPNDDLNLLLRLPIGCRVRHHNRVRLTGVRVLRHLRSTHRVNWSEPEYVTVVGHDSMPGKETIYKTASLAYVPEEEPNE